MINPKKYLAGPDKVRLSNDQWLKINNLVLDINASNSPDDLMILAAEVLPMAIGAEWGAWNEHDQNVQLQKVHITPAYQPSAEKFIPTINQLVDSHPIVKGIGMIKNPEINRHVWSFTDFTTKSELHKVAIWAEAYRHMAVNHQLFAQFCTDGKNGIILAVNSEKAFSEEQRMMVTVLRQHFEIACNRMAMTEPLRAINGARPKLSNREREALSYMLDGKTNPELSVIMGISVRTVEKHVTRILEQFQVENRLSLLSLVLRQRQQRKEKLT